MTRLEIPAVSITVTMLRGTQITSQLATGRIVQPRPPRDPKRRWGRPARKVFSGACPAYEYVESFSPHPRGFPDIVSLRNLRLTSKAFNQSATRVLFRCCRLSWYPASDSPSSLENHLVSSLGDSPLCSVVKRFYLDFARGKTYPPRDLFALVEKKTASSAKSFISAQAVAQALPNIFEHLSELESLEVIVGGLNGQWRSQAEGWVVGGESHPASAPALDIQLISDFTTAFARCLAAPKFRNLTTLHLALPCTYNFIEVQKVVPDTFWMSLKVLFLQVTDATGQYGSKYYLPDIQGGYPDSNLQTKYPNIKHAHGVFDIVTKCNGLKTLGILGTHILDGNLLDWKPLSNGLESLYLERVQFSKENLIKLLSPASHLTTDSSRLTKAWFSDVDLTSGTWSDVFSHLSLCPNFWYFNPGNLRYARNEEVRHIRATNGRLWEDSRNLWSHHPMDEPSLKRLMRRIVREAGGRDSYPNGYQEQWVYM